MGPYRPARRPTLMALRAALGPLGLEKLLHSRLPSLMAAQSCRALSSEARKQPTLAFEHIYVDRAGNQQEQTSEASTSGSGSSSEGPLTAIFLHGLLGSSRNWRTFTKNLVTAAAKEQGRDIQALLIDLRNHGASSKLHGFGPPHTLEAAAGDVLQLVRRKLGGRTPEIVVGHSLGGKVALEVLQQLAGMQEQWQGSQGAAGSDAGASRGGEEALRLPQQVWVLDSQPGRVTPEIDAPTSVARILEIIHSIPVPLRNRQQLYELLEKKGVSQPVAWWLGSNLVADAGDASRLVWTFDIQGASAMYNSYRHSEHWDTLSLPPPGVTMHLVHGERSDRWTPGMLRQLQQAQQRWQEAKDAGEAVGQLDVQMLSDAGHWLQSDNPKGLSSMMLPWFKSLTQGKVS